MKIITPFVFTYAFLFSLTCSAQQNTTAAGGDASGGGGSVSYSIGQVDYIVQTGGGGTANQGVQQPYEILVTTGVNETGIALEAKAFPNPTASIIFLSVKETDFSSMTYSVFDASGKLIERKNISAQQTQIDLNILAAGNYFISIAKREKMIKQFKIIKAQ